MPAPRHPSPPRALARSWSRRHFLTWSLAAGGAASWLPARADDDAPTGESFPELVAAERLERGLPGLAVAVVGAGSLHTATSGVRALATDVPIERNDAWPLAGHARVVTAAVIGRLVEQGTLAWTTTIGETLGYQLVPRMHPAWADVTLAQLLTHRAGLPRYDDPLLLLSLTEAMAGDTHVIRQRLRGCAHVLAQPPAQPPGTREALESPVGYLVAAAMAESLLDRSFEQIYAQTFAPAPRRAAFAPTPGDVHGHVRTAGRWRVESRERLPYGHTGLAPAGSLALPVDDYGRVLQSLLHAAEAFDVRPASTAPLFGDLAAPALDTAAGWQRGRVEGLATLAQASVDPRGYSVFALVQPTARRAVAVWSNAARPGLTEELAEIALGCLAA